ncbi:AAA family ATPase [Rubritalea tangerina]
MSLYQYLNSEKTQQVVASVDASITEVVDKIGLLKGQIAQQERLVKDAIENNQKEINGFLAYAGYKYEVELLGEKNDIKLRLRHTDGTKAVQNGDQHLSYGERNAFAVILFMYECLAQSPDLIILDDPISSFDKNKKFSILHKLFRGSNSLKSKTVLLLTHDVEPVIDTVKIMPDKFAEFTVASYLRNRNGSLSEEAISYGDVLSFKQICDAVRETHPNKLIRLIYLRRYFDILDDKGLEYQMLSSLFKKAATPYIKNGNDEVDFTPEQKTEIESKISELIGGFFYDELQAVMSDSSQIVEAYRLAANGYEKVQIFRLLQAEHEDHVVRKHISETFHIENDLVCQLSPQKYDPVPDFLIETCDLYIDEKYPPN